MAGLALASMSTLIAAYGQNQANNNPKMPVHTKIIYQYSGSLGGEDAEHLYTIETAGRHLDKSKISSIVSGLNNPKHKDFPYALMLAAARMGAAEALPQIDKYADDPSFANYARVIRCRLLAEASVQEVPNSQKRSVAKIRKFYDELNLNVADINATVVQAYLPTATEAKTFTFGDNHPDDSVAIYALREVADMAYQDKEHTIALLPSVKSLYFDLDYPASLKMKLASLSQDERIAWLIEDLANKTSSTPEADYEITLLADEGEIGSSVALTKIAWMARNPSKYPVGSVGYQVLAGVVEAVADSSQAPRVQSLRQYAVIGDSFDQLYQNVLAGRKRPRKIGY